MEALEVGEEVGGSANMRNGKEERSHGLTRVDAISHLKYSYSQPSFFATTFGLSATKQQKFTLSIDGILW